MIKAVIFDIDGVLLDSHKANLDFYQKLMVASGYKKPGKDMFRDGFWRTMWDEIQRLTKTQNEVELRRVWLLGHVVPVKKSLFKKPKKLKETIRALSKRYKLAVATSRTKMAASKALDFAGIKKYINVAVAFEDFKHPKPDPESLILAVQKLKVRPEEAVFIGDSPSDCQAALSANIKFLAFAKKPMQGAELQTALFAELPNLIEKL